MDLNGFMEALAEEIDGQYSEYDNTKSIIIVPLNDGRFQTVLGQKRFNEKYSQEAVEFSSKVCPYDDSIDLKNLLEENVNFCHAKFVVVDDYIQVEAACFLETATESLIKEIIIEVAEMADVFEHKLTGVDVH